MHRVTLAALACLVLAGWIGIGIGAEEKPAFPAIGDKTLVAWVYVDDLKQGGGSALTIEDGNDLFDAIVFGERTPGRWMAGSNYFSRTQPPEVQELNPPEMADPETLVEMAIVYRGKHITIYRNAKEYASYPIGETLTFREQSFAVMGLRHVATGDGACFHGKTEDARIYGVALTPEQIAALEPNEPSQPAPLAWWDFEEDEAKEAMGTFPNTKLFGKAKVAGGMLHLDGRGSYLISARGEVPRRPGCFAARAGGDLIADTRALRARLLADPQRPRHHFVSPEGVCHPFDPNGAISWKGRYHLMYIFQNEKGHCWGHVSSTDLLHWRHHPPALEPGEGDAGIFSGGASLDKNGVPTITYRGLGNPRGICIATSTDDLIETWTKSPHNPVIRETAPGLGDDNTLRIRPPEELALLRYNPRKVENLVVPADGELPLEGIAGNGIELAAKLSDHNPVDRLEPLAKAGIPIFHIHGDVDKVVPLEDNSGLLARRYRAAGGPIELKIAEGQGHNMWRGFFECQELVDFVIRHATGEETTAAANP
ncbi:MAG: LamG-like jellyroll fold domain-containing protein [Planctomycetota bacterium]